MLRFGYMAKDVGAVVVVGALSMRVDDIKKCVPGKLAGAVFLYFVSVNEHNLSNNPFECYGRL